MREKQLEKKIRGVLEDFALTFANKDTDNEWWGHDTNLGKCKEEFRLATQDIYDLLTASAK